MRNYPEWALAFWAAAAVGAVVVPLNAWWTGPELAYGLIDSGSVVLFADRERLERLAPLIDDTDVRTAVAVRSNLPGVPWAEVVAGDGPPLPDVTIDPEDDATIMYTSGTTGRPRGAVATHRNFGNFLTHATYAATAAATAAATPSRRRSPRVSPRPGPSDMRRFRSPAPPDVRSNSCCRLRYPPARGPGRS